MAKTTNVINTTLMVWYMGTSGSNTKIAYSTGGTLSITHSPRSITSKDSGGWEESLEGIRAWSGSCTFWYVSDHTSSYTIQDFYSDVIVSRNTIYAVFKTSNTDDTTFGGNVYVESVELESGGQEESVGVTVSFKGTGSITVTNT